MKSTKILLTVALTLALVVLITLITAITLMFTGCSKEEQNNGLTMEEAYTEVQNLGYTGTLEEFIALITSGEEEAAEGIVVTGIDKTGTGGNVNTYTITFSDGSKIDFTIVIDFAIENDSQSEESHTHTYEVVETLEPTCVEEGYEISECTECGDRVVTYTPATGVHTYEVVETVEPTCFEEGYEISECTVCHDRVTTYTEATGEHEYELTGSSKYCTVCGQEFELTVDDINTLSEGWTAAVLSEDDKTAYVTAYSGSATEVTVPDQVVLSDTVYEVTQVGDGTNAVTLNSTAGDVTCVTMGENVTNIGISAFYKNTKIQKVVIGEHYCRIGMNAFCGCTALEEIDLDYVTYIGYAAFSGATSLTTITLCPTLIDIRQCAFENCTGLKSVTWESTGTLYSGTSSSQEHSTYTSLSKISVYTSSDLITQLVKKCNYFYWNCLD